MTGLHGDSGHLHDVLEFLNVFVKYRRVGIGVAPVQQLDRPRVLLLAVDGSFLDDRIEHVLRSQGEQLVVSLGRVERRLSRARYVRREGVLYGEDVAAHFLHAVLVDLADVCRRLDEEARHQVRHALEDVPRLVLRQ